MLDVRLSVGSSMRAGASWFTFIFTSMTDITLDDVLDLEQEYYATGFKEGHDHSSKEQYLEGKIYGLQTGFQRFLVVGYIKGLITEWRHSDNKAVQLHLDLLEKTLGELLTSNDDSAVKKYEKAIIIARNKVRLIATLTKTSSKIKDLDALIKEVGGSLQVSKSLDDMW